MPTKQKYITRLVQMSCSPSPEENLQKGAALVEDAAERGAEVVCLPELFRSLYFCQR
jgi:N-carbamoylputrescine amidase